jgi:hypothetical protein
MLSYDQKVFISIISFDVMKNYELGRPSLIALFCSENFEDFKVKRLAHVHPTSKQQNQEKTRHGSNLLTPSHG